MKTYTVLVMRPDYMCSGSRVSDDTFMTTVIAESVQHAQFLAAFEACEADLPLGERTHQNIADGSGDYEVLAVVEGQHKDIKEVY